VGTVSVCSGDRGERTTQGTLNLARNDFLTVFFNVYVTEYPGRDRTKTGLECLNRVVGLPQNEFNHQQVLEQLDLSDTKKAETLFTVCHGTLPLDGVDFHRISRRNSELCAFNGYTRDLPRTQDGRRWKS
jgi:hypothetical protein